MIIEPKVKGFLCVTAHPEGCAKNVDEQIERANDMRISHVTLERGNAVAKFEGVNFKRVY